MKILSKNKKLAFISLFVVVAVILVSVLVAPASADVIYTETPAQASSDFFQFKHYYGKPLNTNYRPSGELTYDETTGEYAIRSNSFVMWDLEDNVSFAYRWYHLAHGDQGKMTIETTVTKHGPENSGDVMHDNASVGIHVRGTDDMSGKYIYLHARANKVGIVWRDKDGGSPGWVGDNNCVSIKQYPIYLKMEIQGNAVRCSVRYEGESNWTKFATRYINLGENVMAGISTHSCDESVYSLDKFKDYKVTIEGPTGSKYEPVGSEGGDGEEVEENPCPPDPEITDNVLLRETFTDGSMTNETEYGSASTPAQMEKLDICNPIWSDYMSIDGNIKGATVETEGENRYWHRKGSDDTYFFTNKFWYDYSYSVDLKFGDETNPDMTNQVDLYTRLQANRANGFYGYRIRMTFGKYIEVRKVYATELPGVDNERTASLIKVNYNYMKDGWNTWKIVALDNTITLYCNDEEVLTVTDNDSWRNPGDPGRSVIGRGGIGIGSAEADLLVDNIVVEKVADILGGDFDNKIGGNWDSAIPDYIQNFSATLD